MHESSRILSILHCVPNKCANRQPSETETQSFSEYNVSLTGVSLIFYRWRTLARCGGLGRHHRLPCAIVRSLAGIRGGPPQQSL